MPKGVWIVCEVKNIRKKVDGVGEMVSCFVDENLGLGLRLTTAERERVNTYRVQRGRAPFAEGETPGRCHLAYENTEEGFAEILKQTQDVTDLYEVLYPGHQVVFEFDKELAVGEVIPHKLFEARHALTMISDFLTVALMAAQLP